MFIIVNCKLEWGRWIDKWIYLKCIFYCIKLGFIWGLDNNKFLGNSEWFFVRVLIIFLISFSDRNEYCFLGLFLIY